MLIQLVISIFLLFCTPFSGVRDLQTILKIILKIATNIYQHQSLNSIDDCYVVMTVMLKNFN